MAHMYRWEQPALLALTVVIVIVAFATGNILFGAVIVVGFGTMALLKRQQDRHSKTGKGIHPYLIGGLIWIGIAFWSAYLVVWIYQRNREEPAAWFMPALASLAAVGALVLGGLTLRHWWRDRA